MARMMIQTPPYKASRLWALETVCLMVIIVGNILMLAGLPVAGVVMSAVGLLFFFPINRKLGRHLARKSKYVERLARDIEVLKKGGIHSMGRCEVCLRLAVLEATGRGFMTCSECSDEAVAAGLFRNPEEIK
jgi:UPF0716 family protein affecting phage T7 exclusion